MVEFGLDLDRFGPPPSPVELASRRWRGRYVVDAFGADPCLQDVLIPFAARALRPMVEGAARLPDVGTAVLVANRGYSGLEPAVLIAAVRDACHRRLRVVGYADVPYFGETARRLGAVRGRAEDLRGVLRSGHLAAVLLQPRPSGSAGAAPVALFAPAVGSVVLPVAVQLRRANGLLPRWRVRIGAPIECPGGPNDALAVAEVAEAARLGVEHLLGSPPRPG
jgi:hypothetical protein